MSEVEQQEDVGESNKEDKEVVSSMSEILGGGDTAEATDEHNLQSNSNTELSKPICNVTDANPISKEKMHLDPEAEVEMKIRAGDPESSIRSDTKPLAEVICLKDDQISPKESVEEVPNVIENIPSQSMECTADNSNEVENNLEDKTKNPETEAMAKDIGYKQTVIDNSPDPDMELRWDDDDEMQVDKSSEDALKLLDKELGVTDDGDSSTAVEVQQTNENARNVVKEVDIEKQSESVHNKSENVVPNPKATSEELLPKSDNILSEEKPINNVKNVTEKIGNVEPRVDNSTDSDKDKDNIGDKSNPITEVTGYKETEIDDVSDTDLELRWDDDEDQIQTDRQPSSDDTLKMLDEDLGVKKADDGTNKVKQSKAIDQNSIKVKETITAGCDPPNILDSTDVNDVTTNKEPSNNEDHSEVVADVESIIKIGEMSDLSCENTAISTKTNESSAMDVDIETDLTTKDVTEAVKDVSGIENVSSVKMETSADIESMDVDMPIETERKETSTEICDVNKLKEGNSIETLLEKAPIIQKTAPNTTNTNENIDRISVAKQETDITILEITEPILKVNKETHKELTTDVTDDKISDISTNKSIGIKTDHRINRPDVMLDIPSQGLIDIDDDISETTNKDEKETENDSLIAKTVTEIVNQLAGNKTENIIEIAENTSNITEPGEDNIETQNKNVDNNETNKENDKSPKVSIENTKASTQNTLETIEKVIDDEALTEPRNTEITSEKSTKTENQITEDVEKLAMQTDVQTTEPIEKPLKVDAENQPIETKAQTTEPIEKLHIKTNIQTTEPTEKLQTDLQTTLTEKKQVADANVEPSTSEGTKTSPDDTQEVQEASDSLGLLAESSRTCRDDDDEAELEEDDEEEQEQEEDDDYEPDDESSNQVSTAEHSEDSKSGPDTDEESKDKTYIPFDDEAGVDIASDSNETDGIGMISDSNDADFKNLMADTTDITIEENDPFERKSAVIVVTELKDTDETDEKQTDVESEIVKLKALDTTVTVEKSEIEDSLKESKTKKQDDEASGITKSPNKLKNLQISQAKNIVNIVDLQESDSEDDIQEVNKETLKEPPSVGKTVESENTSADVSNKVEIGISSADSGITDGAETKEATKDDKDKSKARPEIFSLDSDEDDKIEDKKETEDSSKPVENNKCINFNCTSDDSIPYYRADKATMAYYCAARRHRAVVCKCCLDFVAARSEGLLSGIKDLRPLMDLDMSRPSQQLVEISDSESEEESDPADKEPIGDKAARLIEESLTDLINDTWIKYKLDERLKETESYLEEELEKMEIQSKEICELLNDCQKATDKLRVDFYAGFEPERQEIPALYIHDTPLASYFCADEEATETSQPRFPKRQASSIGLPPAKKQAIPMGYAPLGGDNKDSLSTGDQKQDDDKDVSVVRLSAESAPAELPPPGEISRSPLRVGMPVFAMKNSFGAWLKGKVMDILPKPAGSPFNHCRIKFENKNRTCKVLSARCVAYVEPSGVRMTIGTRVIALFQTSNRRESYYSGVVAEIPNPVNSYRYLVFFDDGYAQYVLHQHTRLVCESSALVWEEVHPFSRDFVCNYLLKYPERPMVRMHQGQTLTVELDGKWYETKVIKVDASLVQVHFHEENRTEWIYRGSTRLRPLFVEFQAAKGGARTRLPRSTKTNTKTNMPYVEYTRSDEQVNKTEEAQQTQQQNEEMRRQRAVAKKSTSLPTPLANSQTISDGVSSRVVYYTPKNAVKPYKMVSHTCSAKCKRTDVLSLKELRTYNPLAKPLLSGWERQVVRYKGHKDVMYRAPCGRRVRSLAELHRYLRAAHSDMPVDLFDFNPATHCLAEFVLTKCIVGKKDLSHGKENVPVSCVNYYDNSMPEFCSYNTERTPTAGVPLNLDPEFLCGCDCTDDCMDKTKCACWQMTLEGARTIGLEGPNIGYEYRRLLEPLPSGIYECNSRCKCKNTCLNRVAQHPLQLKLQVFKTSNRGWGIRALNDIPKGSFLCIYAGNLLTDATANLDGINEGDEYLAELDYIEVVEAMKEGYEEDIPEADKELDKKESKKSETEEETESSESEEEERNDKTDKEDDDFQPGYIGLGVMEFNKRLRRRDKNKKVKEVEKKDVKEEQIKEEKVKEQGDDCITISDDEEVREPSRFTAQEGMGDKKFVPKYKSIRNYFGEDEACYIMDAKVQGNIGRYLNHSCSPNVFVQNVFVDTHDPRFPWVSFFALHHIRAGTELTWNYNYDVGSVPGKVLYCFCGAHNCRGRLL